MRHSARAWGVAAGLVACVGLAALTLTAQDKEAPQDPRARLATLAKRVATDPRPDLFFELGRLHFELGNPAEGFEALARGVKLAPEGHHVQTYFLHQLDKSEYKERVALLEMLHGVHPDYPPLLERLGVLYQGKGRDAEAEALFKKWVALRPDHAEPHARIAEFYRVTARPQEAVAHLEKVRALTGESTYALRRLGVIERELGHLERSAELLTLALDQVETRDDLVALVELGHTRMAQHKPQEATEAYAKVVALDPGSPAHQVFLAQARAAAGKRADAVAAYEQAIALDKFNLEAQLGLGRLLLDMGDAKAALPHVREASSRNDRDPDLHFLVGQVALKAGDMATAEREHDKLKQIRSTTLARELQTLIEAQKAP
ncbi:MAG: tetratricopeptide repeat protein [Nitrospirae bacterium]|nr:tetratricopeptide repeat protein [Nitrospirota bacterium]